MSSTGAADASELIQHPSRLFVVGRAQSGKTTWVVDHICKRFYKQIDRIIIICPTFLVQKTFAPMRDEKRINSMIDPTDVYTEVTESTFKKVKNDIELKIKKANEVGGKTTRILILVDDLAGNSVIHNNRKGCFANFAVQTTHWNVSLFVISQQPFCVDPNFRNNCEGIIVFPSEGIDDLTWLKRAYQSLAMNQIQMKEILLLAWKGGKNDNSEWGRHFLFINSQPRRHTRFFIDFKKEINIL